MAASIPAVLVAMPEEAQGFLDLSDHHEGLNSPDDAWLVTSGDVTYLLVVTRIGMVAAARAATLAAHGVIGGITPTLIVSAGTCGGIPGHVQVGDLVAPCCSLDWSADSTSIGYEYGQVPGHAEFHESDDALVDLAVAMGAKKGYLASANAFAVAETVDLIRERFPKVIATDMESAAVSQVAAASGIPFLSLRCVSDMCQGDGGVEFDEHLDDAAARSARATLDLLARVAAEEPVAG
ncbi:5'-methylthioadenosine/S-adenosylhomocysteine nucleosidase [Demequina lignilytica]|uniref:adenosylhomocysteine nucleosidase n=1 Tax=Demequina lignilytica TaxID=3051663 RepID=A0AAW7M8P7_9MICO|nr:MULTISPECIES: 5'-methylthioadenosine/S-adenosylhomocysteine nucleosidase [unclassified Demequina]MDN4477594.1 5'-methylthioadenosine/S-adenosylhomocysteine nucleosidase [Demequina sp. SYSU T00039-1]MDN4483639.1 5'-methylthioadenosine/S-adenosylhomocysteine nucleosidase [Demequina sp. SYSU T0a273]MDN4488055.1 5'-methylthioadenosine/S-adenosylhomocysteine nucleosidase [Demequina sp. SYSU T00039]MDN4490495.1 5'-methylthioadenosine/S-adenosylhomocysteine nucleosidase [Demequina sp. SYSU T00068]